MADASCARCGASFAPRRLTARYCSTACRMAAHRTLSVTPGIITPKVSVTRVSASLAPAGDTSWHAPSPDLTGRAACADDYLMLDHIADAPSPEDDEALVAARGFYRAGMTAGLGGKTGPFPLMAAADLFFYRGWRCARGRPASVPGEQHMLKSERIAA